MDRFSIVLGHYVYYALWHSGQSSREYERLCKISRYFKPGFRALNLETEGNEDAKAVYLALCDKHGHKHEGEVRA
jgi:hypothetical protein